MNLLRGPSPSAPTTLTLPDPGGVTPALRSLLETFIPAGSRCLNVGRRHRPAIAAWLDGHRCSHVAVDTAKALALPFEEESFDAALLIGELDRLMSPDLAVAELRRVLRPGGVLLVTATNQSYWRHRLDRATGITGSSGAVTPHYLRYLLVQGGFTLVGVEGQDGALLRDLPLAGRLCHRRGSGPYRVAERLFPSLLGSRVGAFAIRV